MTQLPTAPLPTQLHVEAESAIHSNARAAALVKQARFCQALGRKDWAEQLVGSGGEREVQCVCFTNGHGSATEIAMRNCNGDDELSECE
eukprot:3789352-Pleurochrysis_carterae.AAC.1